jgi:hypothetical protein
LSEPKIISETAKYVQYESVVYKDRTIVHKEKKFFCLGGDFDGDYKARTQVYGLGYKPFNNAGVSNHTQVWIHKSLLHEEK